MRISDWSSDVCSSDLPPPGMPFQKVTGRRGGAACPTPIMERFVAGTLRNSHRGLIEHTALGASLLCLIHCLALPLLFAALPALSSVIPVSRPFHLVMLAIAVPPRDRKRCV